MGMRQENGQIRDMGYVERYCVSCFEQSAEDPGDQGSIVYSYDFHGSGVNPIDSNVCFSSTKK